MTERVQLQTKTEWVNNPNLRLVVSGTDGKVLWQGGGKLLDIQEGNKLQ
jgi:hypothetical protein